MTTPYDLELIEAVRDDTLAERYGWTIEEIDAAPVRRVDNMIFAAQAKMEAEAQRDREASRRAGVKG